MNPLSSMTMMFVMLSHLTEMSEISKNVNIILIRKISLLIASMFILFILVSHILLL